MLTLPHTGSVADTSTPAAAVAPPFANLQMIRQLRRLTRPVPGLGPGAAAIAIYAEATPQGMAVRHAAETGFEGVACVDDAARLATLYVAIWRQHEVEWARRGALEMLEFVRAMQTPEGWFINFIEDWDGTMNLVGRTSTPSDGPWLARACHALAAAASTFSDSLCAEALDRALPWLARPTRYLDLRAVALLAVLEAEAGSIGGARPNYVVAWAEEIYATRCDGILPDVQGSTAVHLWGHLQECALAEAGVRFSRPEWIEAARESADRLFIPEVEACFGGERTTCNPFDVSCTVRGLDAVGWATGEARYADAAELARAWFSGRNPAGVPVFDRWHGRVYDGIDGRRVSRNSGAEANIEGAFALMDSGSTRIPLLRP